VVRFALPMVALAAGVAVAVGLVSCGSDKGLLPGDNAQQIIDNLNQVEQDAANGDCDAAAEHAAEVRTQIEALGNDVNAQLRQRLSEGADRLENVISTSCVAATTTPTIETTTEETTEPTTTKKTTTTTSTTTSSTTTPTTTTAPTTGEGGGVGPAPPGQTTTPTTGIGDGTG
jgi:hypothetical protein